MGVIGLSLLVSAAFSSAGAAKEPVGPNEDNGHVRLKRFPGWRCTSGAMAGACAKGHKEAANSTVDG